MAMKEYVFEPDAMTRTWVRKDSATCSHRLMETVPWIFLTIRVEDSGKTSLLAWCPAHQSYEDVLDIGEDDVHTSNQCHLTGQIILRDLWEVFSVNGRTQPSSETIPLRWRVSYQPETGALLLGLESAQLDAERGYDTLHQQRVWRPHVHRFQFQSISLNLRKEKLLHTGSFKDIPSPVLLSVLSFLQEEAERLYGIRPELPVWVTERENRAAWQWFMPSGVEQLDAFFHASHNMSLYFLQRYISPGLMEKYSKGDAAASFPALCHAFGVEANAELYRFYAANPFILVITALLERLGFHDRRLMLPFYEREIFFGKSLRDEKQGTRWSVYLSTPLVYDPLLFDDNIAMEGLLVERSNDFGTWNALAFYCQWNITKIGEAEFAKRFLELQKNWQPFHLAAMQYIYRKFPKLPEHLRQDILQHGISTEIHNRIVNVLNEQKTRASEFFYTEREQGYECEIDGYTFHLLHSSEEYFREKQRAGGGNSATRTLAYCRGMLLVAIGRHGKTVACFQLFQGILEEFYSVLHARKEPSDAKLRIAFLHWLHWTGLEKDYHGFFEDDFPYLEQEVTAKPLETTQTPPLAELLTRLEEDRTEGYYVQLYRTMLKEGILPRIVISKKDFASEFDYLMAVLPMGKPIYEAAFLGNPEAQYVLGMCYQEHHDALATYPYILHTLMGLNYQEPGGYSLIPPDKERAADWKRRAAMTMLQKRHRNDHETCDTERI